MMKYKKNNYLKYYNRNDKFPISTTYLLSETKETLVE